MKLRNLVNYFISLNILVLFFVFLYSLYKIQYLFFLYKIPLSQYFLSVPPLVVFYIITSVIAICGILFFLYFFRFSYEKKINISLIIISVTFTLYSIELFNEIYKPSFNATDSYAFMNIVKNKIAKKNSIELDNRTVYGFISDNRKKGIASFPNYKPNFLINYDDKTFNNGLVSKKNKIFPLSNISNIITTTGNEGGFYPKIKTDKFGFNNSNDTYKNKIELVFIGDSFVEGADVETINNIPSYFLNKGISAINLGKSQSGPLVQLAILKEYAKKLKPKKLIWIYFENDHKDFVNEVYSQLLLKYLYESNFSQDLISRQDEIDIVIEKYLNLKESDFLNTSSQKNQYSQRKFDPSKFFYKRVLRVLKFYNIRNKLNLMIDMKPIPVSQKNIDLIKKVILSAHKEVNDWGGEFIFFYLPQYTDKFSFISHESEWINKTSVKDQIILFLNKRGITNYDLTNSLTNHEDLKTLVPFNLLHLHFNEKGYEFISKEIESKIFK